MTNDTGLKVQKLLNLSIYHSGLLSQIRQMTGIENDSQNMRDAIEFYYNFLNGKTHSDVRLAIEEYYQNHSQLEQA